MAVFAEIDENNKVTQVIIISDNDCNNLNFPESEVVGKNFIYELGISGNWIQTSENSNFRKRYAGIGYSYDEENDVFISPQPFPSWILDEDFDWKPPIPMPQDGLYFWNEEAGNWEEVSLPSPE